MASFKNGNDMLLNKNEEKETKIQDFSVSELLAQLEAKGKKIAIIEPGAENNIVENSERATATANALLNDRADLEDSDHGEEPVANGEAAKTGTFGGAKLDGTIKEGYQMNAFVQAQADAELNDQEASPGSKVEEDAGGFVNSKELDEELLGERAKN